MESNNAMTDMERSIFWEEIENYMLMQVRPHIKFILRLQNMDSPTTAPVLVDDKMIDGLEQFVRSPSYNLQVNSNIPESSREDYYGLYYEEKHNFEFTIGHRILLRKIGQFVAEKGLEFWESAFARADEDEDSDEDSE